jgi:hypothetical protein
MGAGRLLHSTDKAKTRWPRLKAKRETIRHLMKEPYRTLLGHFRHEIGHYYWGRLVRETKFLEPYRQLFGSEQGDYAQALNQNYKFGPPANWQGRYISSYATAHPWEDWAETWAHFMHMQDALEIANDFGLTGKRILLDPRDENGRTWLSPDNFRSGVRIMVRVSCFAKQFHPQHGSTGLVSLGSLPDRDRKAELHI